MNRILIGSIFALTNVGPVAGQVVDFDKVAKPFFAKYCLKCHQGGEEANGQLDLTTVNAANAVSKYEAIESAVEQLTARHMPPEDEPQPTADDKQQFLDWYQSQFVDSVKPHPGYFRPRRLSVVEYRNTLRSLFGFDLEVAIIEAEQTVAEKSLVVKLMQTDPPGQSGFRNDTHDSPLTTVLWNHYSYIADAAINELFSAKRRPVLEKITGPIPKSGVAAENANRLVRYFVPKAFRRSVDDAELNEIESRLAGSKNIEQALRQELKVVLMSPAFLYRGLMMKRPPQGTHTVDQFELAERLSYFLWADMPDEQLSQLAAKGTLSDTPVLTEQVNRMLDSPKSRSLADDFAAQWLTLNEIAKQSNNPPQAEALRSQPLDFVRYLFVEDRPLIELIDSRVTFANPFTAGYYGKDRGQMKRYRKPKGVEVEIVPNQKISLVHTKERGGILTMPGVLGMNRGPVIRGTWILERILGEHLPEPPPDVGQVPNNKRGQNLSFRERFQLHRTKKTCSICHDKIDPLGFALQRYSGPTYQDNPKIDTSGKLPSGETFEDFAGLKQILVTSQKKRVIRNIVERTLSYALCRKLGLHDRPTLNRMVDELVANEGTYRDMVLKIATSLPFQKAAFRE